MKHPICRLRGHNWADWVPIEDALLEHRVCVRCWSGEDRRPLPLTPTEPSRWKPPAIPTGKTAPGHVPTVDVDTITARTINRLAGEVNELMFERDQARRERDDECRINEELRAENMRLRRLLATQSDATMPIPRTRSGAANGGRR